MRVFGAHMPTGKGLGHALRAGKAIGCTAVQVFTSSPQQWKAKAVTDEMVADFRAAQAETGISAVVSHDSYLVNLCAPDPEIRAKSIAGLKGELERCAAYGIEFAVSHMGAHMGQGVEVGVRRVCEAAREVLDETPTSVTLLMETTAGQGSSLNSTFEELAMHLEGLKADPRVGVCLDTCHVFAAGYDIRTPELFSSMLDEFDRRVGLDRLKAIHVNDSAKPLGSRKDRHAHLGEGEIGKEGFVALVQEPRLKPIPMLLETPDAEPMHATNLARLVDWSLEGPR